MYWPKLIKNPISPEYAKKYMSQCFYNGGTVPDKIRAEIMAKTKNKNLGIEFRDSSNSIT
jgi:hypothetical protein